MEFVSVRELRVKPGDVWKQLREKQDMVLTSNGRPIALLIDIADQDVEESLAAIRRARAQRAVSSMRRTAARKGIDHLSLEEIQAEIEKARQERKK